jgi:hypothetical protein
MKTKNKSLIIKTVLALGFAPLFAPGCATPPGGLTLDTPAGPLERSVGQAAGPGTLLVYSAPEVVLLDDPNHNRHTGYTIYDPTGRRVKKVPNYYGGFDSAPTPVELPDGKYTVQARAPHYGLVSVPVVIGASRTTTLYLDGTPHAALAKIAPADALTLPQGEVIGRKANP